MRKLVEAAALAGALALAPLLAADAQTAAPPPVEAYGRLPAVQDAAISPDGQRLALLVSDGARTAFRIANLSTGAPETTLGVPEDLKLRGVGWADDQHALFYVSKTFRPGDVLPEGVEFRGNPRFVEYWRVGIFNVTNQHSQYMSLEDSWGDPDLDRLIAPIEGDPGKGRTIARDYTTVSPRTTIYRVDLNRGDGSPVGYASIDTRDVILDEHGRTVARLDANDNSNHWRLFAYDGNNQHLVAEGDSETGEPLDARGLLPDGRLAVIDREADSDRSHLDAVSLADGKEEMLYGNDHFDISQAIKDPWTQRVVGVEWMEDLPHQHFFDAHLQGIADLVAPHFTDGYVRLISWSRDQKKVLLFAETSGDAGSYFLFTPDTNTLSLVGQTYSGVRDDLGFGMRQIITYPARDHTRIPAYLTLPAGADPHHLPLVVLVHGGPHARDDFTFDWWTSFLASRGYAVVRPNYRGSTGYGYAWFNAGRGQWGDGVMQHDVDDAVDALVHAGIADPHRVCIVGASYGGYAALAGAALAPERYACAASVNGVTDVVGMLDETARDTGSKSSSSDWWRLSIGDRRAERTHLQAISPVNLTAQIQAPILLMASTLDTVVPITQSRAMADRMRASGKRVTLVEMPGDDHWLSTSASRVLVLRQMESFLAANIGPNAQPNAQANAQPSAQH